MDKSIHEGLLSQPLQTNNKLKKYLQKNKVKIGVTFLIGFNGIFIVTSKNNKIYIAKTISDEDGFIQLINRKGAYELESLNNKIKRIIVEEEH